MIIEKNKVYNKNFLDNDLSEKSVDLIIADPPYFEVKGNFDFIWDSFDDYLKDVEKWAKEFKRLLKDNGTLFVYGHAKIIAYTQIILDKYFNLENNLVWKKKECQTLRSDFKQSRCFAPVTERCLMYSNEEKVNECTLIHKDLFSNLISKINETAKIEDFVKCFLDLKIASSLESAKVLATYKMGKHATRFDFLSEKMYNYIGNFNYTYEQLRQEYEQLRRPFNNTCKLTDVLEFSQESHITKNYDHDTKKPETLTRALILTCSRENDLILVPFAGSGTECAMAKLENRNYIGFDTENKYVEMTNKRCNLIHNKTLFTN